MLLAVVHVFNYSVSDIAELYASNFSLALPSTLSDIVMIASAVLVGWIGSYIAVGRSLANRSHA